MRITPIHLMFVIIYVGAEVAQVRVEVPVLLRVRLQAPVDLLLDPI